MQRGMGTLPCARSEGRDRLRIGLARHYREGLVRFERGGQRAPVAERQQTMLLRPGAVWEREDARVQVA